MEMSFNLLRMIQILLKAAPSVVEEENLTNSFGDTPLHIAVKNKNLDVMKLLLTESPPLLKQKMLETCNKEDCTPLHMAVSVRNNDEIIELLIANGANVNHQNIHGNTPLHSAAQKSNSDEARILLNNGAVIDMPNRDRETSLHMAVVSGYFGTIEMVALLLDKGADINVMDKNHKTPLMLAVTGSYAYAIVPLLKERSIPTDTGCCQD